MAEEKARLAAASDAEKAALQAKMEEQEKVLAAARLKEEELEAQLLKGAPTWPMLVRVCEGADKATLCTTQGIFAVVEVLIAYFLIHPPI